MPDWISHILIGLIVAELFGIRKKSLIVLGSLLPDFIVKINLLSAFFHVNDNLLFVTRLYHSPVMAFIIPALVTPLFKHDYKKTYIYIAAGFMLHLAADAFTMHFNDGLLLYPFSHSFFSFNLLWPEQYWIVLVSLTAIYGAIHLSFRRHN